MRRWITCCDQYHKGLCRHLSDWKRVELPDSLILIDVQSNCLTVSSGTEKYVALSYVWGCLPQSLETNLENFASLQIKGALASDPWNRQIPRTIRDAITLTSLLGIRYLWVDRLCIVQDDAINKARQIEAMGSIYSNSRLTVFAEDGEDADYGLRGISPSSGARHYEQDVFAFSPTCTMIRTNTSSRKRYPKWHMRGWTFQEDVLSKRKLRFQNGTLIW